MSKDKKESIKMRGKKNKRKKRKIYGYILYIGLACIKAGLHKLACINWLA